MPVALSNCNLANVCQYGGKPKGDGTQGCSCYAAPDCSSKEKCPLGLGGKPKADGTNNCLCKQYTHSIIISSSYSTYGKNCNCQDDNENWRSGKYYTYLYEITPLIINSTQISSFQIYYDPCSLTFRFHSKNDLSNIKATRVDSSNSYKTSCYECGGKSCKLGYICDISGIVSVSDFGKTIYINFN